MTPPQHHPYENACAQESNLISAIGYLNVTVLVSSVLTVLGFSFKSKPVSLSVVSDKLLELVGFIITVAGRSYLL